MPRPASLLLALCISCSSESGSPPATPETSPTPASSEPPREPTRANAAIGDAEADAYELDEASAVKLREAARDYLAWGRVDERPNLAPVLCRAPVGDDFGVASRVRLSKADESPHGRKLYFLFAGPAQLGGRDRYAELGQPGTREDVPVGYTVVKQSWTAEPGPATSEAKPTTNLAAFAAPPPITSLEHDGQRLHAGEQRELFVMTKVGPRDTPGTDLGWIYGTLTPDGETVTSAGRVERCMSCHEHADHERLFGLRP